MHPRGKSDADWSYHVRIRVFYDEQPEKGVACCLKPTRFHRPHYFFSVGRLSKSGKQLCFVSVQEMRYMYSESCYLQDKESLVLSLKVFIYFSNKTGEQLWHVSIKFYFV